MQEIIDSILAQNPRARLTAQADGSWLDAPDIDVVAMAQQMAAGEVLLSTISAIAKPDGETTLIYHFRRGSAALNIKTSTRSNAIPSIAPVLRAASWIEREIHDLYAVVFTGHPNLARLIRPPELPEGFFRQPGGAQSRSPNGSVNAR